MSVLSSHIDWILRVKLTELWSVCLSTDELVYLKNTREYSKETVGGCLPVLPIHLIPSNKSRVKSLLIMLMERFSDVLMADCQLINSQGHIDGEPGWFSG